MSRTGRNLLLFVTALALGAFALPRAWAGNYSNTAALYYSVSLSPGQYFYSSDSRIILVDDITYSLVYKPCYSESACDFFTTGDIPDQSETSLTNIQVPAEGSLGVWGGITQYVELMTSKHDWQEVALNDRNAAGSSNFRFDRCSFATYGQLAIRSYREAQGFAWFDTVIVDQPENVDYAYAVGLSGHSITRPHAMTNTLTSVPTSTSRHYQSPHRVVNGRVYFETMTGSFTGSTIMVKGRTLASNDSTAPAVDSNITVSNP